MFRNLHIKRVVIFKYCFNCNILFIVSLILSGCLHQNLDSGKISQSVRVIPGAVNGAIIQRNGKNLAVYGDPEDELKEAEMVLFTHCRRDVIWAGRELVKKGAHAVVPAGERICFTQGDSLWKDFAEGCFVDLMNITTKIPITPIDVFDFVSGGQILKWQDLDIKVLDTPGYTRGSVSYVIDVDSIRYAFVGDLIYGDGKILDLYNFQDSLQEIRGYHGYALRLGQLISSLQLIARQKPDFIIPSRGPVISEPDSAIQTLIKRVRSVYQNYLSTNAYRWYYPERSALMKEHVLGSSVDVDWMPYAKVIQDKDPSWCMHFDVMWLVFAQDSSAFLIDCGTNNGFEMLKKLKKNGRLKKIDGIFVTHYHSDHVSYINEAVKEFACPVYITEELQDILENPSAYNMPGMIKEPIKNLTVMQEGETMRWKDYQLTFHYFPGQTIYHDAVLLEKDNGEAVFFIGDSFTPTGIDDYCLLNRNLLHQEKGYFYCLDFIKRLPPHVLIANQHQMPLFSFSRQQIEFMTDKLMERKANLQKLLPWDDINYGIDGQWIKFYPYRQKLKQGQKVDIFIKIINHSDKKQTYNLKPNVPDGFIVEPQNASIDVDPLNEGEKKFTLMVTDKASSGVALMTCNVMFNNWDLHEWTESLIEIVK